uniref:Uncharacterized protein n=1 Tax=Anopheles minimus TaxID=112268 RepID=A0A182WPA9_9DIPT
MCVLSFTKLVKMKLR